MPSLSGSDTLLSSLVLTISVFLLGVLVARKFAWPMLFAISIVLVIAMIWLGEYSLRTIEAWLHVLGALTMLQAGYFVSALLIPPFAAPAGRQEMYPSKANSGDLADM